MTQWQRGPATARQIPPLSHEAQARAARRHGQFRLVRRGEHSAILRLHSGVDAQRVATAREVTEDPKTAARRGDRDRADLGLEVKALRRGVVRQTPFGDPPVVATARLIVVGAPITERQVVADHLKIEAVGPFRRVDLFDLDPRLVADPKSAVSRPGTLLAIGPTLHPLDQPPIHPRSATDPRASHGHPNDIGVMASDHPQARFEVRGAIGGTDGNPEVTGQPVGFDRRGENQADLGPLVGQIHVSQKGPLKAKGRGGENMAPDRTRLARRSGDHPVASLHRFEYCGVGRVGSKAVLGQEDHRRAAGVA